MTKAFSTGNARSAKLSRGAQLGKGLLAAMCCLTSAASAVAAEDVIVTTAGECNFPADGAHDFGMLSNGVKNAVVTFTQGGTAWNNFTKYGAVASSTSVFDGVRFGFGETGSAVNFLGQAADSRAIILQGGTIITNVGAFSTSSGSKNTVEIRDNSQLFVNGNMELDSSPNGSRYVRCTITDGGRLTVGGKLAFGTNNPGNDTSRWNGGDRLVVSNANAYAKLKELTLGATLDGKAGKGGTQVWVTDYARMDVGTITTGIGKRCYDNKIYITDGGVVTAAEVRVATGSSATAISGSCGEEVNVWNGGELRVNGSFTMGYTTTGSSSHSGMRLVISNGTFSAAQLSFPKNVAGSNCEVRITGPLSRFSVDSYVQGKEPFGGSRSNRFIVEDGANVYFGWNGYTYGSDPIDDSVIVQGEGSVLRFVKLRTAGYFQNKTTSYTNHFYVASGAVATGKVLAVVGYGSEVTVSNATLKVSSNEYDTLNGSSTRNLTALAVGYYDTDAGPSSNCVVNICGSSPQIQCVNGATAYFRGASRVVYHLPAEGYADGIVPFEADKKIQLISNCAIEFTGAEEMLAKHKALGKVGTKYVLMKAKTLSIPAAVLTVAQTSLPEGMALKQKTADDGDMELVLQVGKPGLLMVVR